MGLDDTREDERQDERPEDREDDTDRAIKLARCFVIEAVQILRGVMQEPGYSIEVRVQSAIALLEVAGCL